MNKVHLDPNETVILEVRRHWFVFISTGLFSLILAIAPLFLFGFAISFFEADAFSGSNRNALFWLLYSLWLLIVWMSLFVQWTNYYLDVWYITQKRIIDVEQRGLFHRHVSNLRFDKIQDISIEVRGILAHFFQFGDVHVQTAGQDSSEFIIKHASHPERIREAVFKLHNREAEKPHAVKISNEDNQE